MDMKKTVLLILSFIVSFGPLTGQAIQVHPENPHYYLFHGKPTVLRYLSVERLSPIRDFVRTEEQLP